MKIIITGHTRGLGKHIHSRLHQGHNVFGMTRTNGYDIVDNATIDEIINDAPDILINNAWSYKDPWAQYRIQDRFVRELSGRLLITIGTRAVDWGLNIEHPDYVGSKEALHKHTRWAQLNTDNRTLLIRPGLLDVERFEGSKKPKVDPSDIASCIDTWLNKSYMRHVSEVVFTPEG